MNSKSILLFVLSLNVSIVKSTHEVYNEGYMDGYNEAMKRCESNMTINIDLIEEEFNSRLDNLEVLIKDREGDFEYIFTVILILIIIILLYLVFTTVVLCCYKISNDMKKEEIAMLQQSTTNTNSC